MRGEGIISRTPTYNGNPCDECENKDDCKAVTIVSGRVEAGCVAFIKWSNSKASVYSG